MGDNWVYLDRPFDVDLEDERDCPFPLHPGVLLQDEFGQEHLLGHFAACDLFDCGAGDLSYPATLCVVAWQVVWRPGGHTDG